MFASHQLALAHGERMHRIPSERAWAEFQFVWQVPQGKYEKRWESMGKHGTYRNIIIEHGISGHPMFTETLVGW